MNPGTGGDEKPPAARAIVERYLANCTSTGEQDPAVRGLLAARWYGQQTRQQPGELIISRRLIDPTDEAMAEEVISELFGEVLLYGEHRDLDTETLFKFLWDHYASFDRFEPTTNSPAEEVHGHAYSALSRLLADLLLCGDRLGLDSHRLAQDGHARFVNATPH
ncbi:hypothetical protein [Streptomyces albipurpureus]|uniref:Uncharacterized protein n=1 Tax=Streptomyces albipurpureus TaxID=2897419 RepID=A0ABT0UK50_9ACTN|nr:hypothetical protein [Streptomyces sp. CWNU-1]MCM2388814.1 hypothetical protein [Streptomyces sp. CWNU-1]